MRGAAFVRLWHTEAPRISLTPCINHGSFIPPSSSNYCNRCNSSNVFALANA